jgi:xanthine dehydrogenase small subunit
VPLLAEVFPQFASRLIRNGATLGGNLGTGSPIGDMPPALLALDARLVLADADGEREVALADYFTGYRQSVRRRDELIKAIRIPLPLARWWRSTRSPSAGSTTFPASRSPTRSRWTGTVVRKARIGLGGVAAMPIRALATEAALGGQSWTAETAREAGALLRREGTPIDDHRASAAFRVEMLGQSLPKLYAEHPGPDGRRSL